MQRNLAEAGNQWVDGIFIFRSGYYIERPPSESDLSSNILEMIYRGLKKDIGQKAARNFVRFVDQLRDLSASSFIIALEQFWGNGCNDTVVNQSSSDRNRLDGRGLALHVESSALIAQTAGGCQISEEEIASCSRRIKQGFINSHRDELLARR